MLGDFYIATNDLEKATGEYGSLYQQYPKDVQVKKNYVQLLILKYRLGEARKLNDELVKANHSDVDTLESRVQIETRDGHLNDAADTVQTAIKNDPDNGVAHYHM